MKKKDGDRSSVMVKFMLGIIDKLLIFICCSILYIKGVDTGNIPVPMLIVIILSCICSYFENKKINRISVILFTALCIISPRMLLFLPVIIYDIFNTDDWKFSIAFLLPIVIYIFNYDTYILSLLVVFIILSYLSKYKTSKINNLLKEYHTYQDSSKELKNLLEDKNYKLLEKQDNEIHIATLNERNRISKEIHDNIGHLISRSLIHIGALLTISKEDDTKEGLKVLQNSLSEGMDSIRHCIHNIHDESIDLYSTINNLVSDFSFCLVNLNYNLISSPPLSLKYFFIWTIKEALSNIIKHSKATSVSIILAEHPIMYQLIIQDNGTISNLEKKKIEEINQSILRCEGMGLQNMIERVYGLDGIIRLSGENGFKIFITIPIKKAQEEVL
ncbi:sensor histidine kinase [Alkalibaculum sp. M08DMB]|uniref:histidine kinase n=1 Tax=Alkalibaculum sporogenes TaxID=2655001 RepID=A0A6A7K8F5_9FIRM|nr:histidine kinase [Alkalibaculum sporogenes]MPW25730.1 sensor histidine kinase [Alkalibaculum sporogenes]